MSKDAEAKTVCRLTSDEHAGKTKLAHVARQFGIARSSVYRMLAEGDTESQ